uniref:Uncharacterized protein n=1 Tax=Leersia perrieri TaxID=77586 RepID=A0A0D9VX46_9ORYZ
MAFPLRAGCSLVVHPVGGRIPWSSWLGSGGPKGHRCNCSAVPLRARLGKCRCIIPSVNLNRAQA